MNNERLIELINAGIDGELNESEEAELRMALDQSSEARSLQAGIQELAATLSNLPQQDPPDHLRKQILENVQLPARQKQTSMFLELRAFAGYGLAIAAGAIMIVGIYQLAPRDATQEDLSNMSGTISQQTPVTEDGTLDEFSLDLETISGLVRLQSRNGGYILDFDLRIEIEVDVLVTLMDEGLNFGALEPIDSGIATTEVSASSLKLSPGGHGQFTVSINRLDDTSAANPVRLTAEFFTASEQIYSGELESTQ